MAGVACFLTTIRKYYFQAKLPVPCSVSIILEEQILLPASSTISEWGLALTSI
jgi:hypothetical protein